MPEAAQEKKAPEVDREKKPATSRSLQAFDREKKAPEADQEKKPDQEQEAPEAASAARKRLLAMRQRIAQRELKQPDHGPGEGLGEEGA